MDMHVETYNRLSVYWDVAPLALMSKPQYVSSALRTSNFTNIIYQLFYLITPFTPVNDISSNCLIYYVTPNYIHRTKDWVVSWPRRLVTDLSLRTHDFKPRPVLVGFVVERVVLR
jgi:hypothetical protein